MKKILKTIYKTTRYLLGGLLAILLFLIVALWFKSPGKADLITDGNGHPVSGSLSSIEKITLGGIEQYFMIRGLDSTKPVILFLHGGPGFPELPIMKKLNTALENDFLMVYWEQRGGGKSYSKNIPVESMTIAQLIADTRELSEYLTKRFKQDKIYLMGHSWGSFLGILTAHQHPEFYHSFFGVGQICNQYKAEKIALDWLREEAIKRKDTKAIKTLSELAFPDSMATGQQWLEYIGVERNYVTKYGGGAAHEITNMWPMTKMLLNAKEYTIREKFNYLPGLWFSMKHLWPEMINTNLFHEIDSMPVPVYIFQGKHDYQTSYYLAKDFFDQLKAPKKDFFTFENSAHSPLVEEVDKFNSIVKASTLTN